jgi:hypothetical protein
VDLHLLASTCASQAELYTQPLARMARRLDIAVRE